MSVTLGEARLCPNFLLGTLSDDDLKLLLPKLELVEVKLKENLYERDATIPHVFFPTSAVISNMVFMANGTAIEVGTVGNEGFSPMEVLLDATTASETAICQIAGKALRIGLNDFKDAIRHSTSLRNVLQHYGQAYLSLVSQSVACNRLHHVDARFARWLLTTHDRVHSDDFYLTQEFLADMLGVHRPSVSIIASAFQKAGLIQYSRGHMKILDRTRLAKASCECYGTVRSQFKRLAGIAVG